jgi:hypothetical protein
MKSKHSILGLVFLMLVSAIACAQDNSAPPQYQVGQQTVGNGQQPANASQPSSDNAQQQNVPAPAFGQDAPSPQTVENPPLSGLDQPALEPDFAARSFLVLGAHATEGMDTNAAGKFGGGFPISSVTRLLGSAALQRLWKRYALDLDYIGGGGIYENYTHGNAQIQALNVDQRIRWRTGQLAIRDSFSDLPEGSFGYGSFGGAGGYDLGGFGAIGGSLDGGGATYFSSSQIGSLGQTPRVTNTSLAEVQEVLSPRSSFTAIGSYGFTDFIGNISSNFINTHQFAFQAGYNYQLNRRDQLSFVYGYQDFHYPATVDGYFTSDMWHLLWGHRISGRLNLIMGGGPQLRIVHSSILAGQPSSYTSITGTGRASLTYKFPKTSLALSFERVDTNGSGILTGATSDIAKFNISRPIRRHWTALADLGYAHNTRILPTPGSQTNSYQFGYVAVAMRRAFSRYWDVYGSYQFNELSFNAPSLINPQTGFGRISQRQVVTLGVEWHPRPIRLD